MGRVAEVHYGYKNYVKADAKSKLLERYAVTDASVHDSQKLAELVASADGEVYADSAYRSAEAEALLVPKEVTSQIHERAYRNRPLTEEQKESNRQKSKLRAAAERGGDRPDQPGLQPGPIRTNRAVEVTATDRRLKTDD